MNPALAVLVCGALSLTSGGVSGLGRQEAAGQRWGGGRLEAVGPLVVRQWPGGHSVMGGLFAPAQTWNTARNRVCGFLLELSLV